MGTVGGAGPGASSSLAPPSIELPRSSSVPVFGDKDNFTSQRDTFSSPQEPEDDQSNRREGSKQTEAYGFVLWVTSFVCYALFLMWAVTPEDILNQVGVSYYPSKYWAIAGPTYICFLLLMFVLVINAINFIKTPSLSSFETLTDSAARNYTFSRESGESIPDVHDIPITIVNKVIFDHEN